jgi:hypothetical protein
LPIPRKKVVAVAAVVVQVVAVAVAAALEEVGLKAKV